MQEIEKNNKIEYIIFAIIFVIVICALTFAATYAYFKVSTDKGSTLATVNASAECLDISYGKSNDINLDYQYPITDTYALNNVVPLTITVTNNCTNNTAAIPYTLAITSLKNASGYISDNAIRMHVKKQTGNSSETVLKTTNYLSNATKLTTGKVYDNIMSDLGKRTNANSYTTKTVYSIDSSTVANSITNTYKVYLWVDYYEGDANAYSGSEHDSSFDGITEGLDFAAAVSLVVNVE